MYSNLIYVDLRYHLATLSCILCCKLKATPGESAKQKAPKAPALVHSNLAPPTQGVHFVGESRTCAVVARGLDVYWMHSVRQTANKMKLPGCQCSTYIARRPHDSSKSKSAAAMAKCYVFPLKPPMGMHLQIPRPPAFLPLRVFRPTVAATCWMTNAVDIQRHINVIMRSNNGVFGRLSIPIPHLPIGAPISTPSISIPFARHFFWLAGSH